MAERGVGALDSPSTLAGRVISQASVHGIALVVHLGGHRIMTHPSSNSIIRMSRHDPCE